MAIVATVAEESPKSNRFFTPRSLFWLGLFLLIAGIMLFLFLLTPALNQEFRYWKRTTFTAPPVVVKEQNAETTKTLLERTVEPIDENFGIVIPKIEANARVIKDVDWTNASVYQQALRYGVAHARGTALPGQKGNIFIFAHSGVDFSEAARYNAVFYLMNKLTVGDEVALWYEGKPYRYRVFQSKKVKGDAVEYLAQDTEGEILTLMTCFPAGTTWKRLIVQAERIPD